MGIDLDTITTADPGDILGEVLQEAGPGVLLTSCVNSISFGMGAMLPIPGLADFCIGAAVASVLNLFTIMTIFLPYICLECNRVKTCRKEFPCQAPVLPEASLP